jgi:hypothetical protein
VGSGCPGDIDFVGDLNGIVDLYAKLAVVGATVDRRRLDSAHRVRGECASIEINAEAFLIAR